MIEFPEPGTSTRSTFARASQPYQLALVMTFVYICLSLNRLHFLQECAAMFSTAYLLLIY